MKYTWLVEKYLEGELSGEALKKFELEILKKPEVAEEVERIRFLTDFSREQHMKMSGSVGLIEDYDDLDNVMNEEEIGKELEGLMIRKISSSQDGAKKIGSRISELQAFDRIHKHNTNRILVRKVSIWIAGSAMAILIGLTSILLVGSSEPAYTALYREYYSPRPADVQRAINLDPQDTFSKAMAQYINGDYYTALHLMDHIPETNISNEFFLYKGISAMEIGEYTMAIEILNKLDRDISLRHEGMWYKSLCYLALEDINAVKIVLNEIIQDNGYHKDKARSLMRKL